jgi:pyruvate,water dikinase
VTRFVAEIFPGQFARGFGEGLKRYGLLLENLDYRFVASYPYFCLRPVGAPPDAVGHPARLGPAHGPSEITRLAASAAAFEQKSGARISVVGPGSSLRSATIWRSKPWSRKSLGQALGPPQPLPRACRRMSVHHRFNVPALLPVRDFLAVRKRGRVDRHGLLALLREASLSGAADEPIG